jgi:hypothetical protein
MGQRNKYDPGKQSGLIRYPIGRVTIVTGVTPADRGSLIEKQEDDQGDRKCRD